MRRKTIKRIIKAVVVVAVVGSLVATDGVRSAVTAQPSAYVQQ